MINFVNAKINLGLSVVGKREDGYHLLETCFLPIGKYNGTPLNPQPFGDILEIAGHDASLSQEATSFSSQGISYRFEGNTIDCPFEKNLVVRAGNLFAGEYSRITGHSPEKDYGTLLLTLWKLIPDGAGLGGGSADATFTLKALNEICHKPFDDTALERMALQLGADCPVFVKNEPVFAEGIGEIFSHVESDTVDDLTRKHYRLLIVKPDLHISTREAFAGIHPHHPEIPLREVLRLPLEQWEGNVVNDFEASLFPSYPELARLKQALYSNGAIYASMTGSGAALYGIYPDDIQASAASRAIDAPYKTIVRL